MRLHDLIFGLAVLAAVGHLAQVAFGSLHLSGGIQEQVVDQEARSDDGFRLETALAAAPRRAGTGPDVLLIVIDGLRADHAEQMPELARFAARARSWPEARAAAPYAYASQGSLATGLLPTEHGAIYNYHGRKREMRADIPTFASLLAQGGWRTVSLAADPALAEGGALRGFDVAIDDELTAGDENLPYFPADRITDLALTALRGREPGALFLQLHYSDPELPWIVRTGPCARAVDDPKALPPGGQRLNRSWREVRAEVLSGGRAPTDAELRTWQNAYDAELCFLDGELGRLFAALPELGIDDEDWVVVVGSHGLYLGEHGLIGSGWDVYEEALQVPLYVRGPGLPPGEDRNALSTMNLPRVLLAALGLPALPDPRAGQPLPGALVSELHGFVQEGLGKKVLARFRKVRRAVLLDGAKLVLSSDGAHEGYLLAEDPHEARSTVTDPRVEALLGPSGAWSQSLLNMGGVQ